jgi:hypothetical protein
LPDYLLVSSAHLRKRNLFSWITYVDKLVTAFAQEPSVWEGCDQLQEPDTWLYVQGWKHWNWIKECPTIANNIAFGTFWGMMDGPKDGPPKPSILDLGTRDHVASLTFNGNFLPFTHIIASNLTAVRGTLAFFDMANLESIDMPKLAFVNITYARQPQIYIRNVSNLRSIVVAPTGVLLRNHHVSNRIPATVEIVHTGLATIDFSKTTKHGTGVPSDPDTYLVPTNLTIQDNETLQNISLPEWQSGRTTLNISNNHPIITISFDNMDNCANIEISRARSISFPLFTYVKNSLELVENSFEAVTIPLFESVEGDMKIVRNSQLTDLSFAAWQNVGTAGEGRTFVIEDHPTLFDLNGLPSLTNVRQDMWLTRNFSR